MIEKVKFIPSSYATGSGKWVPSGVIIYKDSASVITVERAYKTSLKNSKESANSFFLEESEKELKKLQAQSRI